MESKAKSNPFFKFCLFLAGVLFVGALATLFLLNRGSSDGVEKIVLIPKGTTLSKVADILEEQRVIENKTLFKALLRLTDGNSRLKAGEFVFSESMRPLDAIAQLYDGEAIVHKVTFPEGWTIRQMAQILAQKRLVDFDKFVGLALSKKQARRFKIASPNLEGYLFPDTYTFSRVDGEAVIIKAMVNRFFEKYKRYRKEAKKKGYKMEWVVTLASIIEKETGAAAERPTISSVFHNRLDRGMRLQSDPTTIYGIKNFDGNLTRKHLRTWTPYNTYRIKGLPPGPIASPGEASIAAAIRPARTKFLYFVSNNNGTHIFSRTYKEHSQHVNRHQKRRRSRMRRRASEER